MGNSKLAQGCQMPTDEEAAQNSGEAENGILARVPGNLIAQGLAALPAPTASSTDSHQVVIDAHELGAVRLFVEKKRTRHGRSSHYYWAAWRAEPEQSPPIG